MKRYSFSGADSRIFAYYPGLEEHIVELESFNTLSVSVYEAKSQARALGYRGVKGTAGAIRTISGSFIMTVIEDHPLRVLADVTELYLKKENLPWGQWSLDKWNNGTGTAMDRNYFYNRLVTTLPPFNLLAIYVSEGAQFSLPLSIDSTYTIDDIVNIPGAVYLIEGVDFISDGLVTSIHDIVSENTFTYIAQNFMPMSKNDLKSSALKHNLPNIDYGKEAILKGLLFDNVKGPQNDFDNGRYLPSLDYNNLDTTRVA